MCSSTFLKIRSRLPQRTNFLNQSSPDAEGLGAKIYLIGNMEILARFSGASIVVVKKTFRFTNIFLLQPHMPPFLIPDYKNGKRYNPVVDLTAKPSLLTFERSYSDCSGMSL